MGLPTILTVIATNLRCCVATTVRSRGRCVVLWMDFEIGSDEAYVMADVGRFGRSVRWLVLAAAVSLAMGLGCSESDEPGQSATVGSIETAPAPVESEAGRAAGPSVGTTITVGDIDADDPAKKIKRFQPLAEYLAREMQGLGVPDRECGRRARLRGDGAVHVRRHGGYLYGQRLSGPRRTDAGGGRDHPAALEG